MRLWDKTLAALIVRYTQRVYNAIRQWVGLGDLEQAQQSLEQGYRTAHVSGVRWSLLDLLGFRERVEATPEALERLAKTRGLEVEITQPQVLERLGNQISVAKSRMLEHLSVPGTEARAAGYAVRWGVQQGIADVAEHSSVALPDGSAGEILKQWLRLAARAERRVWHDALNGVTIPYSQKFRLSSPRGIYLIDRPYDPALPVGEKIGCGHGTRLLLPEEAELNASSNGIWKLEVHQERIRKGVQFEEGISKLSKAETDEVLRGLNQAGLTEYLKARPLKELTFQPLPQPSKGFLAGQYDELEQRLTIHSSRPSGTYGQDLKPSKLEAFSASAPDAIQAIKYSMMHEIGHHLLLDLKSREGWIEQIQNAFAQGGRISQRAGRNWEEYFCESWVAHTFNPGALKAFDLFGHAIIERVREELKLL